MKPLPSSGGQCGELWNLRGILGTLNLQSAGLGQAARGPRGWLGLNHRNLGDRPLNLWGQLGVVSGRNRPWGPRQRCGGVSARRPFHGGGPGAQSRFWGRWRAEAADALDPTTDPTERGRSSGRAMGKDGRPACSFSVAAPRDPRGRRPMVPGMPALAPPSRILLSKLQVLQLTFPVITFSFCFRITPGN